MNEGSPEIADDAEGIPPGLDPTPADSGGTSWKKSRPKSIRELAMSSFNGRISREGRWDQYRKNIESFEKAGLNKQQSRVRARSQLHPVDGSLHEFVYEKLADGVMKETPADAKCRIPSKVYVEPAISDDEAAFERLRKSVDQSKTASVGDEMVWVVNKALVDYGDIDPDAVPSMGALWLLRRVKRSEKSQDEFAKSYTALAGNKNISEQDERRKDDGRRRLFTQLDDFKASVQESA